MSITIPLVTMAYAKKHLDLSDTYSDDNLNMKLLQATQIVLNDMKTPTVPEDLPAAWVVDAIDDSADVPAAYADYVPTFIDPDTSPGVTKYLLIPGTVQAAICLITAALFESGDGASGKIKDALSLLEGYRTPTLA